MQICVRLWFKCVVVYVEYWLNSPSLWSISSFCPFCHPFWDHFPGDTRRDILHSSYGRMHPKDRTWSRRSYTSSCVDCCEECKVAMGLSGPECKPFSSCQSIASSANHAWETWTRGAVFIKGKSIYILYCHIFRYFSYLLCRHFCYFLLCAWREMSMKRGRIQFVLDYKRLAYSF